MICHQDCHVGAREVQKLRYFHLDGKMVEGCVQCTEDLLTNLYPTTQQWRTMPDGKSFKISPAHVRDIKHRRVAPDLSHNWTDKKGLGNAMRY